MSCKLIDGLGIAAQIRKEIAEEVRLFTKKAFVPTLAAIMVGDNPASEIYIQKKLAAAKEVGINAFLVKSKMSSLLDDLDYLNDNIEVHGYIMQLPLPVGVDPVKFFPRIEPLKDVDVFHPENVGRLVLHRPRYKPCTPHGIQVMLHRSGISVAGKKVVVINRSNVVGKPLSSMLIQECDEYANATVTVCHDQTPPQMLKEICLQSDIIVVAVGKPSFLTADMVKPEAVVVDVGITRQGKKVVGDVDPGVQEVAGYLTPVPGGVGPMTIAMLLSNTLAAAKIARFGDVQL